MLVFQLAVDVGLLLLPGRVLLSGLHLGPGPPRAIEWGGPITVTGSAEQSDFPLQLGIWWEEVSSSRRRRRAPVDLGPHRGRHAAFRQRPDATSLPVAASGVVSRGGAGQRRYGCLEARAGRLGRVLVPAAAPCRSGGAGQPRRWRRRRGVHPFRPAATATAPGRRGAWGHRCSGHGARMAGPRHRAPLGAPARAPPHGVGSRRLPRQLHGRDAGRNRLRCHCSKAPPHAGDAEVRVPRAARRPLPGLSGWCSHGCRGATPRRPRRVVLCGAARPGGRARRRVLRTGECGQGVSGPAEGAWAPLPRRGHRSGLVPGESGVVDRTTPRRGLAPGPEPNALAPGFAFFDPSPTLSDLERHWYYTMEDSDLF